MRSNLRRALRALRCRHAGGWYCRDECLSRRVYHCEAQRRQARACRQRAPLRCAPRSLRGKLWHSHASHPGARIAIIGDGQLGYGYVVRNLLLPIRSFVSFGSAPCHVPGRRRFAIRLAFSGRLSGPERASSFLFPDKARTSLRRFNSSGASAVFVALAAAVQGAFAVLPGEMLRIRCLKSAPCTISDSSVGYAQPLAVRASTMTNDDSDTLTYRRPSPARA